MVNGDYSTGHLIRNRKAGPGWISYLRMGACVLHKLQYNNDSRISYFPVNLRLPFLLLVFLLYSLQYGCPVRCIPGNGWYAWNAFVAGEERLEKNFSRLVGFKSAARLMLTC